MKNKEAEITNLANGYLEKYPDIEDLISEVNKIGESSGTSLLKFGDKLAEIKDEIEADEQSNKFTKKKIFTQIKKQTAEKVNAFDVNTINRVVGVSIHKGIKKFRDEGKLPERWGTLALLTKYDEPFIQQLIETNKIDSTTSRKQLKEVLDETKVKSQQSPLKDDNLLDDGGYPSVTLVPRRKDCYIDLQQIRMLEKIVKNLGLTVEINSAYIHPAVDTRSYELTKQKTKTEE